MDDHNFIKLALLIAHVGGFKDYLASATGLGFRLREHDADRDKPFSPFYLDLRAQNSPDPGPLTPEIIQLAGEKLAELLQRRGLLRKYAYVAGIPNAGEPFAKAALNALPPSANLTSLKLIKQPIGCAGKGYRFKLEDQPPPHGTPILLIDDLASTAGRKLHAATLLREHGLIVTDYVVLVDRRRQSMRTKDSGLNCHCLFKAEEMVSIYREFGIFENPEIPSSILNHLLR